MQNKMLWAGRIVSGLVCLPFVMSAVMKLQALAAVMEGMAHLGIPENLLVPLAIIELACVIIYAIPKTSVLGAVLFTGYMGGTMITHLRVGELPVTQVILALVVWLGIYLREPRLHSVLPVRK